MASRKQLHDLVERLPDSDIGTVYRLLIGLLADPLWVATASAADDDEQYTPEQRAQDAEAEEAIERGEGVSHEDVLREFDLK